MPKNECNIFFFFAGILGVLKVFTKHIIFILAILHHPEMKVSFLLNMNIPSDFGRVWKQTISWRFKKQSEHTKNIHSIHATESHRVDSRQFLAHSFWFAIHLSGFFFKNRPTLKLPLCFKSFLPILVAKRIQPTGWNLVDWTWLLDQNDIRTCGHDGSEILWFPECCNDWQEHKLIYNIFKWWFGMRKYKYMGRLGTIQEVHSKHEFKQKRS